MLLKDHSISKKNVSVCGGEQATAPFEKNNQTPETVDFTEISM